MKQTIEVERKREEECYKEFVDVECIGASRQCYHQYISYPLTCTLATLLYWHEQGYDYPVNADRSKASLDAVWIH